MLARQANTLSRALFQTGQSSNGSAMSDERKRMERVLLAAATLRAAMYEEAHYSEVRESELKSACNALDDLMSDYSLGRAAWESAIEEVR